MREIMDLTSWGHIRKGVKTSTLFRKGQGSVQSHLWRYEVKGRISGGSRAESSGFIRKLSSFQALADYIRQLSTPTLVKLIDEVGLEDSQEIVAAMDARQFRETVATSLWRRRAPGRSAELDIDQFVDWVALCQEEGDVVLARRLQELNEDLVVACFTQLIAAADRTAMGVHWRDVEIGNYVLSAKNGKHWPRIVEVLVGLWSEEPEFAQRLLRRCSVVTSILDDESSDQDRNRTLLLDIDAERLALRVSVGHVDPMDARLFLMAARTADLLELCRMNEYDLTTAMYLAKASAWSECAARVSQDASSRDPEIPSDDVIDTAARRQEFSDLDLLLRRAGVIGGHEPSALLTFRDGEAGQSGLLHDAIVTMGQSHAETACRRLRELGYLANVLLAAGESQGKTLTERDSVRTVVGTANLGATFLLRQVKESRPDLQRLSEYLEHDPGTVQLFQIGFHLISGLPSCCGQAIYRAKDMQSRRPGHVVYMEMQNALGANVLTEMIAEGRYGEAKSVVDELTAVMDAAACVALRILIDPIPAFPNVLDVKSAGRIFVNRDHRPISTFNELEQIEVFLSDLSQYCGN